MSFHRYATGKDVSQLPLERLANLEGIVIAADPSKGRAISRTPFKGHDLRGKAVLVRMGIHSGHVTLTGSDYVGLPLHEVARIMGAGHGGQVLVSRAARDLAKRSGLPSDLDFLDLGEHALKDLARPERIFQLTAPGLRRDFPDLRLG